MKKTISIYGIFALLLTAGMASTAFAGTGHTTPVCLDGSDPDEMDYALLLFSQLVQME
ncbi:MAG TPA: hypothetical protein VMW55_07970 [Nitrosopumilaceae archaeon]|nr:hypothetical protein [Nitrosopumilaceae archaeon]